MTINDIVTERINVAISPNQYVRVERMGTYEILFEKEFKCMYERLLDMKIRHISSEIKVFKNDFSYSVLVLTCF